MSWRAGEICLSYGGCGVTAILAFYSDALAGLDKPNDGYGKSGAWLRKGHFTVERWHFPLDDLFVCRLCLSPSQQIPPGNVIRDVALAANNRKDSRAQLAPVHPAAA